MYTVWQITIQIIKQSFKILNYLRILITNLLFLITIISIIGIVLYLKKTYDKPPIKGALIMDIAGNIVDQPAVYNKIQQLKYDIFKLSKNKIQENSLFAIADILRQAKNDENITGLILSLKNLSYVDQTSLEYIGKILYEFRNSGKPIYAIGDYYTQTQYFLASYANKIYLTPNGSIDLHGMATNKLYFKQLLDKLKIDSHIFRVGKYKSAVEPFLRNNMSEEAKDIDKYWINQIWKNYLNTVSYNRGINPEQLFPGAKKFLHDLNNFNGDYSQYALHNKLIDVIASNTSIEDIMKKKFGWNKKDNTFNSVSIYEYPLRSSKAKEHNNQIAVIIANGTIIDGEDTSGSIGGDSITEKIKHARLNPKIKALILRINSPGGSFSASELIRSELIAMRESKKPIVISMGGIAASGGYWISTPANIIIANNNTLTGSIGIFGIINTFEKVLNNFGIYNDGVTTSPLVNIGINKTLSPEYIQMIQININKSYDYFITTVAQSRHITPNTISEITQGQIFTGTDALKYRLIDYIGDFDCAIEKAAALANLKIYQLNWYIEQPKILDIILLHIMDIFQNMFLQTNFSSYKHLTPTIINSNTLQQFIPNKINTKFTWNDPNHCYALAIIA
ncbi:signal peptide peptidase SppA [Blochmannia endosymbiont of Polyrhachis (Hedomyrma) turneri]|uniref:signal peptide peptidase SppA n=1 Tax=Blochmannia endosymbiont of Polyrhachis (Hedomyrma) turneri TaxID=1505596 RepID=UPI00061A5A13|nr:signal peptide peptidase SppA [Blochmannia endosymbiont of Polyrhachis (Hedomyrma) turneri]AKC60000.1 Protease 4 [Blochmannia endosymbiont of Polyrhachis (Hedomyrma) turneri]